jgi:hypothetical protein
MSESILIIVDDTSILPGVPASNITVTYENTVIEITQQEYEIIEIAEAARGVPGIQGPPGEVEEHTHIIGDVTGLQTALDSKQAAGSYAAASHTHDDRYYTETEIDAFLEDITPADHTHVINDITGLQTTLDGKQAAGSYATASHTHDDRYYTETEVDDLIAGIGSDTIDAVPTDGSTNAVSSNGVFDALATKQASGSYAAASHTHIIDDVTGLQTALDGKQASGSYAAASHTHIIADTTGLQTALDGKQAAGSYAAASHTHDDRYYTETEIDSALALKQNTLPEASSTQDGYLTSEDYLRFEDSANTFIGNALVSGSAVWSGTGLVYNVTDCVYYIDGVRYTSVATNITLNAADVTHPRIDIIYVDSSGVANKITGTPGANPIKPIADPSTQLELTSILVPAGATTPSGVTNENVYAENIEWATSSNGTGSPNFDATTDPFAGSKHISVSAFTSTAGSASQLTFTDSGTNSVGSFTSLNFRIKLGASFPNSGRINILLKNGSSIISSNVIVQSGQYGFSRNDTTNYQLISIPISAFTLSAGAGTSFDVLVLSFYGTGGSASMPAFRIDGIVFQAGATGGTPTGVTTFNSRNGNVLPAAGDYTATQITNTPSGTIAATTVQAALNELDTEKQATLVSATNIKTINGSSLLGSGDLSVVGSSFDLLALQALGSAVKGMSVGMSSPGHISGGSNLNDTHIFFTAVYVTTSATLTGVKFFQSTQGNFTGDNTNGIALYSYSGGTLTKRAESANDPNIWKGATGTWQTIPFASTYAAAAGIYFIGFLYNQSAQTTAPQVGSGANTGALAVQSFDFSNSVKLSSQILTQSSFASSYASSSMVGNNTRYFASLY